MFRGAFKFDTKGDSSDGRRDSERRGILSGWQVDIKALTTLGEDAKNKPRMKRTSEDEAETL